MMDSCNKCSQENCNCRPQVSKTDKGLLKNVRSNSSNKAFNDVDISNFVIVGSKVVVLRLEEIPVVGKRYYFDYDAIFVKYPVKAIEVLTSVSYPGVFTATPLQGCGVLYLVKSDGEIVQNLVLTTLMTTQLNDKMKLFDTTIDINQSYVQLTADYANDIMAFNFYY